LTNARPSALSFVGIERARSFQSPCMGCKVCIVGATHVEQASIAAAASALHSLQPPHPRCNACKVKGTNVHVSFLSGDFARPQSTNCRPSPRPPSRWTFSQPRGPTRKPKHWPTPSRVSLTNFLDSRTFTDSASTGFCRQEPSETDTRCSRGWSRRLVGETGVRF
jgi:hypothetical protein